MLVLGIRISSHKILDKYMLRLFFTLIFIVFIVQSQAQLRLLEPAEFETEIRQNPDAILVDLRNVESYMKGHIKKATVIDFFRDDFKEFFQGKYKKDTKLLVYGQSAENSQHAGLYINELGYKNVTSLKGGFENWIRKSKPYKSVASDFKPLSFVSRQNYIQMLREKKWVLMVFHEDYCKDCETMDKTFAELKSEIPELYISKINFQTNVELAEWQEITKNPTIILYKNGIQHWKSTGLTTKEKIKNQIY